MKGESMTITYPKDCYPRTNWRTLNGKELPNRIALSREQFEMVINEIRGWTDNIHLEMNLGAHFKIMEE